MVFPPSVLVSGLEGQYHDGFILLITSVHQWLEPVAGIGPLPVG